MFRDCRRCFFQWPCHEGLTSTEGVKTLLRIPVLCYLRVGTCMKITVFYVVFIQPPDRRQPNTHECTSRSVHEQFLSKPTLNVSCPHFLHLICYSETHLYFRNAVMTLHFLTLSLVKKPTTCMTDGTSFLLCGLNVLSYSLHIILSTMSQVLSEETTFHSHTNQI